MPRRPPLGDRWAGEEPRLFAQKQGCPGRIPWKLITSVASRKGNRWAGPQVVEDFYLCFCSPWRGSEGAKCKSRGGQGGLSWTQQFIPFRGTYPEREWGTCTEVCERILCSVVRALSLVRKMLRVPEEIYTALEKDNVDLQTTNAGRHSCHC